ncbi:unnamed protein product [Cuscuta campestris]|uniref:WAT1-related protein n=1 Tax=Cuscuta campestris TaxID=132261 RepID=A0A484N4R5_9ASTE|nr:unnamed protein product [Cuscuta campestris]
MTTPLNLLITIVASAVFLGEILTLGSIIGAILLIGGLYSVLWGKREEQKEDKTTKVAIENNTRDIERNPESNESGRGKDNARVIEQN